MKRPWLFAWSTLATGLIAILGVIFSSRYISELPSGPSAMAPRQMAGQVSPMTNQVFLKGGPLQQGVDQEIPTESITEETVETVPAYKIHEFTAHPGQVISITLKNLSTVHQQHNWVLIRPGTKTNVQNEAKKVGPLWQWIPDSPDVLAFIPLTSPGESKTIQFRAPQEPGDYPFLCTYPNHGNVMNGILHVLE